jgi:hypothetical protein
LPKLQNPLVDRQALWRYCSEKLRDHSIPIAELDTKYNITHLKNLASAPLPRPADWQHLARQQDMI